MTFTWEGEHLGFAAPGGRALFTTRRGGVSWAPFDSLDLEPYRGRWGLEENQRRVGAQIGIPPAAWAQSHQVHETRVRTVDWAAVATDTDADGQATALPGVACVVRAADCLPVALIAPEAVAAVHAGWRGLAAGVLEGGVESVRALGASRVVAAVGPGAGACCYEVGPEVHAAFGRNVAHAQTIDLKAIARERLVAAGVDEVHDAGLCTICDVRFFSHRRDAGRTGRQAGIAWRT